MRCVCFAGCLPVYVGGCRVSKLGVRRGRICVVSPCICLKAGPPALLLCDPASFAPCALPSLQHTLVAKSAPSGYYFSFAQVSSRQARGVPGRR